MSFLRVISRSKRPFEVHLSKIGLRHVKKVEINATQCLNFTLKKDCDSDIPQGQDMIAPYFGLSF